MMPTAGPRAVVYHGVRPEEATEVVEQHLRSGQKVQHLIDRNSDLPPK
jgi:(2Fe-2S) ferredoxin